MKMWGSWEEDPLDLKCIRLDAMMAAGDFMDAEPEWSPKTLEDCYSEEFKHYTRVANYPLERALILLAQAKRWLCHLCIYSALTSH